MEKRESFKQKVVEHLDIHLNFKNNFNNFNPYLTSYKKLNWLLDQNGKLKLLNFWEKIEEKVFVTLCLTLKAQMIKVKFGKVDFSY